MTQTLSLLNGRVEREGLAKLRAAEFRKRLHNSLWRHVSLAFHAEAAIDNDFSEFFAQLAFVVDFCFRFYLFGVAAACFLTAVRTLYSLSDTIASQSALVQVVAQEHLLDVAGV